MIPKPGEYWRGYESKNFIFTVRVLSVNKKVDIIKYQIVSSGRIWNTTLTDFLELYFERVK